MNRPTILVTEDGKTQREMLRDFLVGEGYDVLEAEDGKRAIAIVKDSHVDIILLDYKMPAMDGMEVLKEIKSINPEIDVIMMTAYGTIETAVNAMKAGAYDYVTKPVELDELLVLLERISEKRDIIRENEILKDNLRDKGVTADQIIYQGRAMEDVVNMAGRVATSRAAVLIRGESGTGKELISKLIHNLSPRSERPMITVNCAALPETLLESELFGHEKGAFTGSTQRRIGRFEEADGGTLFLDEIGELSPGVQVKLLRFLQEKEFQRLGGNLTLKADVRVISATNRDLDERLKNGDFREDLYYRLNVVVITVPPLRERKEDIPLLIDYFMEAYSRENGKSVDAVSREARDLLIKYDYPGNVRELENIIERAVVITRDSIISKRDLPFQAEPEESLKGIVPGSGTIKENVEMLERGMIERAMNECSRHQTRAAESLGISERMLRYKLKKYGFKK